MIDIVRSVVAAVVVWVSICALLCAERHREEMTQINS